MKKRPISEGSKHSSIKNKATSKTTKTKTVKIKHHHHKPYRKRHISGLAIFVICGLFLMAFVWQYRVNVDRSLQSAQNYINNLYDNTSDESYSAKQLVTSTYGFSIEHDQKRFFATALDGATGDLFIGSELDVKRAYKLIRLSPLWIEGEDNSPSLSMQYYDDLDNAMQVEDLENKLVNTVKKNSTYSLKKINTENVTIAGQTFTKSSWERESKSDIASQFTSSFVTYTGYINEHPMLITVNRGISSDKDTDALFNPIIESLQLEERSQATIIPSKEVIAKENSSLNLIDKLTLTKIARAAERAEATATEKNSAIYGPAVVKIYNVYCMDITFDGKPYLRDVCDGQAGSGFFVAKNGYIATNGHVAATSPKDIVIKDAFTYLLLGNSQYFDLLAEKAGLTLADLQVTQDKAERVQIALDKLYSIPDSTFAATNSSTNLLVCLNQEQPDTKELLTLTEGRKSYSEQDSIKQAKLVSADFRLLDGVTAFRASDVAIIKIEGDNFPTAKIGSIDAVTQGGSLSIFGFPGIAGDNGISESKESKVTLTSGKVSSIKNAKGSDKKLIETDATIGHGNSGGPVLSDSGDVVGIATYTVDGSGSGDGVYNYIRDIKDLKDLAGSSSVSLVTEPSGTQSEWEKGLALFYKARYSSSVKSFEKVKVLYPQHPNAAEFIATAQERIKNGEDVKDFPILIVGVGVLVVLAGIGAAAFLIIRHKKAHNVYKANVAMGAMQPLQPGAQPVQVSYNPAQVAAINNPILQQTSAATQQTTVQPQPMTDNIMPVDSPMAAGFDPQVTMPQQNITTASQQDSNESLGQQVIQPTVVAPSQSPSSPVTPTVQTAGTVITPNTDQQQ